MGYNDFAGESILNQGRSQKLNNEMWLRVCRISNPPVLLMDENLCHVMDEKSHPLKNSARANLPIQPIAPAWMDFSTPIGF